MSELVIDMNTRISDGHSFIEQYSKFKGVYFFLDIDISYEDIETQQRLRDFVPTIRKACIPNDQISSYQKMVKNRLGLKIDEKAPLNLSDFLSPQRISINLDYLEVLVNLGVSIARVWGCITATKANLFKPLAQKLFTLKSHSQSGFEKNWLKLIGKPFFPNLLPNFVSVYSA